MPECYDNFLQVFGDTQLVHEFIINNKSDGKELDFNKSVPCKNEAESAINWGTGWNAGNVEIKSHSLNNTTTIKYKFITAWNRPAKWLETTAKKYDKLTFTLQSAVHWYDYNDVLKFENGVMVDEYIFYHADRYLDYHNDLNNEFKKLVENKFSNSKENISKILNEETKTCSDICNLISEFCPTMDDIEKDTEFKKDFEYSLASLYNNKYTKDMILYDIVSKFNDMLETKEGTLFDESLLNSSAFDIQDYIVYVFPSFMTDWLGFDYVSPFI